MDGGQGEAVRVPFADATLVKVPGSGHSDETMRSLLTLSDVMGTGHHVAVSAGVKPGSTVAVVGDGAVGLCAIIAAKGLGAGRIIALSRNPARHALACEFGATDIVAERASGASSRAAAKSSRSDRATPSTRRLANGTGTGRRLTTSCPTSLCGRRRRKALRPNGANRSATPSTSAGSRDRLRRRRLPSDGMDGRRACEDWPGQ